MASELELQIQQHLLQYLSGAQTLNEFEDWFVPVLWDIEAEDEPTRELAGAIHVLISEFSRGDRTADSLREEFAATIPIHGLKTG